MKPPVWTLDDARTVIANLSFTGSLSKHFAVGLTGSVLLNGGSTKDLDLLFYPLCVADRSRESKKFFRSRLRRLLREEYGWTCLHPRAVVLKAWRRTRRQDTKWVEIYKDESGRRIDVILVM